MNELLLAGEAAMSALFVILAWRFGKEQLYCAILVFLILIASVGGKIVEFFGHATNTGNIFYASVFLATYFLIERYGRREGIYSVWIGILGVIFFSILVQLTVALTGSGATNELNHALAVAFSPLSRLTIASLVAYTFSQNLNVYLYIFLKHRWNGTDLWLRANISNTIAQILDSFVFFMIAFWGVVPLANVWDVIMTGFVIKVIYMMIASPLLYLNRIEQEDEHDYSSIKIR